MYMDKGREFRSYFLEFAGMVSLQKVVLFVSSFVPREIASNKFN